MFVAVRTADHLAVEGFGAVAGVVAGRDGILAGASPGGQGGFESRRVEPGKQYPKGPFLGWRTEVTQGMPGGYGLRPEPLSDAAKAGRPLKHGGNHGALDVFIHPNTGDELSDHRDGALWLGKSYTLDLSVLA